MAKSAGEGSAMDRLAYRIGYASARMDRLARAARRFADVDFHDDDDEEDDEAMEEERRPLRSRRAKTRSAAREAGAHGGAELATQAALGALASRFITPNPINWPRAVMAGTLGALVYEVFDRVELRLAERKFDTSEERTDSQEDDDVPSWVMRCATGVALASLYAKYAYGRLPGPPLVQGIAFGALEAATHTGGGAAALLTSIGPERGLPFGDGSLAGESDSPHSSLVRHLAFGATVGLIYRR